MGLPNTPRGIIYKLVMGWLAKGLLQREHVASRGLECLHLAGRESSYGKLLSAIRVALHGVRL